MGNMFSVKILKASFHITHKNLTPSMKNYIV